VIQFIESVLKWGMEDWDRDIYKSSVVIQVSLDALNVMKESLIQGVKRGGDFQVMKKMIQLVEDINRIDRDLLPKWREVEKSSEKEYKKKEKK